MPFALGNTPQLGDSRRTLLVRWLGALQALPGSFTSNDPTPRDTRNTLLIKIDRSRNGTGTNLLPSVPLTFVANTFLDWSGYTGASPDHWNVYKNGALFDTLPGSGNNEPTNGTALWYVQGFDALNAAFTNPSNTLNGP